jgi:hypothetical protein
MKKLTTLLSVCTVLLLYIPIYGQPANALAKADSVTKKQPIAKPVVKKEIILPTPEFINQPFYYDRNDNRLIKLEGTTAQLITKKKTLGLKGAKQSLVLDGSSSKIRFTSKTFISFYIKTSGDVIDLTSYIKLYKFSINNNDREVEITSKGGLLNNKDEKAGKMISLSVKLISKDVYTIQSAEPLEAGEYGFVWVKNMELKEFSVFSFGIDWKNSD